MVNQTPRCDIRNCSVTFSLPGGGGKPKIVKAVNQVSLEVMSGETVGLVGESGCGKTTLGRAIAQFQPVDSGKILLDGVDLMHLSGKTLREQRRRIQMIFQNPFASLNPRMTVFDTIAEVLPKKSGIPRNEREESVASFLEQVQLDPATMRKFPHEFSGGQRQRIAIARALAVHPSLIIADEPVSSLDVSVAAQILNLLHDLRDTLSLTMLLISHDLAIVRYMAQKVAVMYRGKIVEAGSPARIYSRPLHPYTATLLEAVPVIPERFPAVPFFKKIASKNPSTDPDQGCVFAQRCAYAQTTCREKEPEFLSYGDSEAHFCACFRAGKW